MTIVECFRATRLRVMPAVLLAGLIALSFLCALPVQVLAQQTEAEFFVSEGLLDLDDKRYEQASANFRRALEIEPENVEAMYYTGVIHLIRKQPDQALPLLEKARAKSPADPAIAFQLGLAYFALDRHDRAQPLLEEAFKVNPELDGLGYYVGFLRYRNKDYRGALDAFRKGRASDPEVQQLTRLYASLALGTLGLTSEALAEVEQALRTAPSSGLTGPAERFRDQMIAARSKQKNLSVEVRAGLFFDDNVPVIPDRDNNERLVPILRDRRHSSTGELFGARVDYGWLKPLIGRDDWDSTVGYSFFATVNNRLPEFDITNHVFSTSLLHTTAIGAIPTQTALSYSWDLLTLGGDEFLKRHTVLLSAALVESDRHLTQVFTRFQNKNFSDDPALTAQNRDGDNWMFGFTHLIRFNQDAHFIKAGWQFDAEDPKGSDFKYRGHRLVLGGQYTLPWYGIRLKYDLDTHFRDYPNRQVLLPTSDPGTLQRRDVEVTQIARVEVPLPWLAVNGNQFLTERSFTLSIDYQRVDAKSNVEVFDYTRNVGSISLIWSY